MQTRIATIANAQGIHCRPSSVIMKEFETYPGTVRLSNSNGTCDVSSVLGLLSLEMTQGSVVRVEVEGPDEKAKADRMVELLETHFDFPPLA